MKTKITLFVAAALALCSCIGGNSGGGNSGGGNSGALSNGGKTPAAAEQGATAATRQFPEVAVPSVYGANTPEAREYVLQHYWDAFFRGDWDTTPDMILGVADAGFEQALANYIQILKVMKLQSTPDDMGPFTRSP